MGRVTRIIGPKGQNMIEVESSCVCKRFRFLMLNTVYAWALQATFSEEFPIRIYAFLTLSVLSALQFVSSFN
jgi:hypothetical protein